MFLTFRNTGKCYKPSIYLGFVFLLCCQFAAHAVNKDPVSQAAPAAGTETPSSPETHEERNMSEAAKSQTASSDQLSVELSSMSEKSAGSIAELELKQKNIYFELNKKIDINTKDIDSQKFLVENYAAGGFETLLKMAELTEKIDKLMVGGMSNAGQKQNEQFGMNQNLSRLWMLVAILLVSLAPLAFTTANGRQTEENQSQQQTVLFVCLSALIAYFLLGFGLMFGTSASGWIGVSSPVFDRQPGTAIFTVPEFMLYQLGFPILAALIINKAISEALPLGKSILLALFIGAVVVPVFGHWAAAGRFITENSGWLETEGFLDNAGSTTIHSIAAWFILVWAKKLGGQSSALPDAEHRPEGEAYSAGAVMFLWLGTMGLSTGTLSSSGDNITMAMLNVGLAAAGGGLGALLQSSFTATKLATSRGLGGVVSALAAIGACATMLTNMEAILVGACAGIIYNLAYELLRKYMLPQLNQDLAANLIAMHGVGGLWGSLCVALFGSVGLLAQPKMTQLFAQLEGIITAFIYSIVLANLLFLLFNSQRKQFPR